MIFLLVFLIEVTILVLSERKRWGNVITPLSVLAIPYTIATIIAVIVSYTNVDIPDFYFPSSTVWILGLFLFSIPSFFISYARKKMPQLFLVVPGSKDDSYTLLKWLAIICLILSLKRLVSLYGSIDIYGTDEFSEEYEVSGVFNHLMVLLNAIFCYSIFKADLKQHWFSIVIIALTLIGMFAVGTKSWIISPFLIGYYTLVLSGKRKLSVKSFVYLAVIIITIFFLSYYLILIMAGGNELNPQVALFLGNHFINYLSGGSLALSLDYQNGFIEPEMTKMLFSPFYNLYNVVVGNNTVESINPISIDIGLLGETNVRTFFGTIYAYSHSTVVFIMVSFIWSTVTNFIYLWAKSSRSLFALLANCTNLSFLTLGFFDFYWLSLTPYELIVIFFLMHCILYRPVNQLSVKIM